MRRRGYLPLKRLGDGGAIETSLGVSFKTCLKGCGDALIGRRSYVLLRRHHDVSIRRHGHIPLRRVGNIPPRRHWVFHFRPPQRHQSILLPGR